MKLFRKLNSDSPWVPRVAALATALVALLSILSALRPQIRGRDAETVTVVGEGLVRFFHAVALPMAGALLVLSLNLYRRRRRALYVTVLLLIVLGFVNMLKGFFVFETLLSWVVAYALYRFRDAFNVDHDPLSWRSVVWRVPLIAVGALLLIMGAAWLGHPQSSFDEMLKETSALIQFKHGPLWFETHRARAFHHTVHFSWIPMGVHMVEVGALLVIAYLIFRPLAIPLRPSAAARRRAIEVVQQHGTDTLAFFKLRPDKLLFFNQDRTAFVGYRIEAGTLLLSGDPVGPTEAIPELLLEVRRFARIHGLKLAAIGASRELLPIYDGMGLHSLYLGDEAVVDVEHFSLEGRPIRKVRQSVTRLRKAGYTAEGHRLTELDDETLTEIDHIIELGRMGHAERGFSMAMDSIHGVLEQTTIVVFARDDEGRIRAVLHFVPCFGRDAVSLSLMRRDPDTPNGLTEFIVVAAIERLREHGIKEMSLNFAALSKYLREPDGLIERLLGRAARLANPYFQIESLYRFNVKFFPRWNPRYLVYEGRLGLGRAALASIWAEGQMPKPALPKRQRDEPDGGQLPESNRKREEPETGQLPQAGRQRAGRVPAAGHGVDVNEMEPASPSSGDGETDTVSSADTGKLKTSDGEPPLRTANR